MGRIGAFLTVQIIFYSQNPFLRKNLYHQRMLLIRDVMLNGILYQQLQCHGRNSFFQIRWVNPDKDIQAFSDPLLVQCNVGFQKAKLFLQGYGGLFMAFQYVAVDIGEILGKLLCDFGIVTDQRFKGAEVIE